MNDWSWIFLSTGEINQYNPDIHEGTQPIRVLNHMNMFMFQNTHPNFAKELNIAFEEFGFAKTVNIVYGETRIENTPYIRNDNKTIYLDETFLSYLWCICHSIYTLYIQKIDYPRCNKINGNEAYEINPEIIESAEDLFGYAKSLIAAYSKWDVDSMPNPEKYLAERRDFIEQPNGFYTEAIKFILCHEYIHAIRHIDEINAGDDECSHYKEFEREADNNAIELLKKGIFPNKINELAVHIGVTLGILSMFYFRPNTDAPRHPNTEDRLVDALVQMELTDESPCWGIALIGLDLWAKQFDLGLEWKTELREKEAFDDFISQIKAL
ncbi:hypothetical protein [Constantimarinum furrinae]|uniref:Peptidase U49 n=1 Tax=Constantimarinum furrinae TaxID=2562285 RepID=A0A7G8PRS3_9FLAO|nr:hypothetical protein [Constantimarinum furrinae]QNJ97039.1 hypothetical protein ALE3EI_0456 [Constantimarinum furrinae]